MLKTKISPITKNNINTHQIVLSVLYEDNHLIAVNKVAGYLFKEIRLETNLGG